MRLEATAEVAWSGEAALEGDGVDVHLGLLAQQLAGMGDALAVDIVGEVGHVTEGLMKNGGEAVLADIHHLLELLTAEVGLQVGVLVVDEGAESLDHLRSALTGWG